MVGFGSYLGNKPLIRYGPLSLFQIDVEISLKFTELIPKCVYLFLKKLQQIEGLDDKIFSFLDVGIKL